MPKVMPVAIKDQTGDFVLQMAKGNQALARLYAQLLARYEERQAQQEFQREMFDKQSAEKRSFYDYTQGPPDVGDQQHPFGSRGAPGAATPAPSVAPTAPAAKPAAKPMPMMPGATPIPGQDSFTSGTPTTPASPVSGQVPVTPGYDSFAQAGAGDQEFSAQQRTGIGQPAAPQVQRTPRAARSVAPPAGQLPRGTGMDAPTRRTRRPPAQADFLPIGQEWLDKMAAAEKKYNVPQGSLLALYGFENSGGRFLGKNPKSSAAGLFQFTEALMKDYKVDPALRNNPDVMIDLAARNMRRNANVLEKHYGIKLEPNAQTLPLFTFMHQFGVTDGPRFVKQYLTNPNVPATVIMDQVPGRNNPKILADNGIPSNSTVGKLFDQHTGIVQPWFDNGLKLMPHTAAPATTAAATPPTTPPTPPANIPNAGPQRMEPYGPLVAAQRGPENTRGVNPRLIAAARGGEQYLPEGYTLKLTSGARPTGRRSSQHYGGNASDWQIYGPDGKPIKNSGPDSTGMYERWARGVKAWVAENDPQLAPRMAWGGAFETSRGSGRADLMHLDLGGSRGRLVPRYQYANLKPLGATDKRGAQVAAAATQGTPQQPQQAQAQQVAMRQPKPSEMGDVTKAFGVTPSEPLTATKDVYQEAMFGDPKQAAPIPRIASSPGGQPVPAGDETLSARSGLNFIAGGPPVIPQASGVAARSDLDYGAQREAPAVGPYEAPPTPTPEQREAPLVGPYEAPPAYDETMVEGPTQPQDQLELPPDWEQMQRGPNIAGPPINLQGQLPNFPPTTPTGLPPWELPDVASLPPTPPAFEQSHNYDPSSRAGRRIDAARRQQIAQAGAEYPIEDYPQYQDPRMNIYERVARGAVDTANIVPGAPAASAVADPTTPPSAQPKPTTIRDITKAIYGSEIVRPRYSGGRGAKEVEYTQTARQAPERLENAVDLEKMKEAITQSVGAPGDKYGARPPEGTPNSVMEMIKRAADAYVRYKQPSVQADAIKKKPQAYGADWMPKTPQATTAKPTKPGDEDEAPAPTTPLKVIPKPGGAQQSTQMPNVTKSGPAAPKGGGGAARKAAAMARAKELGEKMYSWDNDEGATEFGELQ